MWVFSSVHIQNTCICYWHKQQRTSQSRMTVGMIWYWAVMIWLRLLHCQTNQSFTCWTRDNRPNIAMLLGVMVVFCISLLTRAAPDMTRIGTLLDLRHFWIISSSMIVKPILGKNLATHQSSSSSSSSSIFSQFEWSKKAWALKKSHHKDSHDTNFCTYRNF